MGTTILANYNDNAHQNNNLIHSGLVMFNYVMTLYNL